MSQKIQRNQTGTKVMSEQINLVEELTPEETEAIELRLQEGEQVGVKYQDFNKRVAKVREILLANEKFLAAIELDTYLTEKSPEKVMMFFRRHCDPSDNGQFTQWVCEKYAKQSFRVEDYQRVRDAIATYMNRRTDLEIQQLNQYKSLSHLEDAISKLQAPEEIKESNRQLKKRAKQEGSFVVFESDVCRGKVIGLKTAEAATFYAAETRWCTSQPRMFHHYFKDDEIYVFIAPSGRKYQLHEATAQFMDAQDCQIYSELESFVKSSGTKRETYPLREDFQFILDRLPDAFCQKTLSRLGIGVSGLAQKASLDSENPKEQSVALLQISEVRVDQLVSLAKSHRSELSLKACLHSSATDEVFKAAFSVDKGSLNKEFYETILQSKTISDSVLSEMLKSAIGCGMPDIAMSCAKHPNVRVKTIIAAYMTERLELIDVACASDLAPEKMLLDVLAKFDSSTQIYCRALSNKNTPFEKVEPHLKEVDQQRPQTYMAALKHPKTPSEFLTEAVRTSYSPSVLRIAALHQNATEEVVYDAYQRGTSQLLLEIAGRPTNDQKLKDLILTEPWPEVRRAFALSSSITSDELVRLLARSKETHVKSACLANARFPLNLLQEFILNGKERSLKPTAIQNDAIPMNFLRQLANEHKESAVRLEAKSAFIKRGGSESELKAPASPPRRIYMA